MNIDIRIFSSIFKNIKTYLILFVTIFIISCDNPQSPSWITQISLPLLNTTYLFSEMVDEDNEIIVNENEIISVQFFHPLVEDENPMEVPDHYFVTDDIELEDLDPLDASLSFTQETLYNTTTTTIKMSELSIPSNLLLQPDPYNSPNLYCIPSVVVSQLPPIEPDPTVIDIKSLVMDDDNVSLLFEDYNSMLITNAEMTLEINNTNFPFALNFSSWTMKDEFSNDIFTKDDYSITSPDEAYIGEQVVVTSILEFVDEGSYDAECDFGGSNGWIYNPDDSFIITDNLKIEKIISVTGNTYEKDILSLDSTIETEYSIPLILPNCSDYLDIESCEEDIECKWVVDDLDENCKLRNQILTGLISSDINDVNNRITFSINNETQFDLLIELELQNFTKMDDLSTYYDDESEIKTILLPNINASGEPYSVDDEGIISDFYLKNSSGTEDPIEDVIVKIKQLKFLSKENAVIILDDLNNMSINIVDLSIKSIIFDKLTAILYDLEMDIPSMTIDNIPSGIEGIEFTNPSLEIIIDNPIGFPSTLEFSLIALDNVTEPMNIEGVEINYPVGDQEIATTKVIIENNECRTEYDPPCNTCSSQCSGDLSLLLQDSPSQYEVNGKCKLNGTGELIRNSNQAISGDFEFNIPFTIITGEFDEDNIIYENLNIVPAQASILTPVDSGTKQSIDNSFDASYLRGDIENHSYIGGDISILVSNNVNFFPLNLDELVVNPEFNLCNPCIYGETDSPNYPHIAISGSSASIINNLEIKYQNIISDIFGHQSTTLKHIFYYPLLYTSEDNRVKLLEFIGENDTLTIGRIGTIKLPDPLFINDGLIYAEKQNFEMKIDPIQITLFNYSDPLSTRYLNTLISLTNTHYVDEENNPINETGVIDIYPTDFININSYGVFFINAGEY